MFAAIVLSIIMCVPMESLAFVISERNLLGSEVFGRNDLPTLILLRLVWAAGIGLLASVGSRIAVALKGQMKGAGDPQH